MVTMVVRSDLLDFVEFHKWLDVNDPGWTWLFPRRKGQSTTVREGNSSDRDKLEWIIDSENQSKVILQIFNTDSYLGPFRVHYRFSNMKTAMLAKLIWGHMRPYRMGTSA